MLIIFLLKKVKYLFTSHGYKIGKVIFMRDQNKITIYGVIQLLPQ